MGIALPNGGTCGSQCRNMSGLSYTEMGPLGEIVTHKAGVTARTTRARRDVAHDDIVSSNSFALRGERSTSRHGLQVARSARSPHLVFIRCRRDSAWMLKLPAIKRESKSRA